MGRYFIILKFSKFFYHKYLNQVFPLTPHGHVLHHYEILKFFYHKCLNQVIPLTPHGQVLHHFEIFEFFPQNYS